MSNIHGIGEFRQNQGRQQGNQQGHQSIPLMGIQIQEQQPHPLQESFFQMIKFNLCPSFNIRKFIVQVSIIQILTFIISLSLTSNFTGAFLAPDVFVLEDMGAKYTKLICIKYQIWRLLTPVFLHGSFMHIFFNLLNQSIFGIQLEQQIGYIKMMILYLGSGIGGNLLSAINDYNLGVGASTAILGIFSGYLAFLIINWKYLEQFGNFRCCMLMIILMITLLNIFSAGSNVDQYGHLGGFITGLFISFASQKGISQQQKISNIQKAGYFLTLVYIVTCVSILFTSVRNDFL